MGHRGRKSDLIQTPWKNGWGVGGIWCESSEESRSFRFFVVCECGLPTPCLHPTLSSGSHYLRVTGSTAIPNSHPVLGTSFTTLP